MFRFRALLLLLPAAACGDTAPMAAPDAGPTAEPLSCGGEPCAYVISALRAPRPDESDRVVGLDLDDRVSDEDDALGCGHPDFVGIDGTPGVDNEFSTLVPALDAALGESLDDALRERIFFGEFLFLVELVPPPAGSGPTTVEAGLGALTTESGHPDLDPRGKLLPEQTYARVEPAHSGPASVSPELLDAPLGEVVLQPFSDGTLPLRIVDARLLVPFADGTPSRGALVGHLDIEDLIVRAPLINGGHTDNRAQLEGLADLDPDSDGVCQSISIAVEVELVRARIDPS